MKTTTLILRILFALLFSVFPALPFYLQLINKQSNIYQLLTKNISLIVGAAITITIFCLVMLIFYLNDKTKKSIYVNEIIFNAALEGLDQNDDRKSYTNKENRALDALKKNPNLSSKQVEEIMKDKFPTWPKNKLY